MKSPNKYRSIKDSVAASVERLEDYIEKCGGIQILVTRNNIDNTGSNRTEKNKKINYEEKQLHGRFKRLTRDISYEKTWMWQRKEKFIIETESLLIAAKKKKNAIRINHIKTRIDKTQQHSKCRLCGDRDETINHISECSKSAQEEYKTIHDWVRKVIHRELCKKLKFEHTNKSYMYNQESVPENETHKLLWDFDLKTDHLISAR